MFDWDRDDSIVIAGRWRALGSIRGPRAFKAETGVRFYASRTSARSIRSIKGRFDVGSLVILQPFVVQFE
jgi:hypothetical protein